MSFASVDLARTVPWTTLQFGAVPESLAATVCLQDDVTVSDTSAVEG